jgi:hypothetical protein
MGVTEGIARWDRASDPAFWISQDFSPRGHRFLIYRKRGAARLTLFLALVGQGEDDGADGNIAASLSGPGIKG